VLDNIELVARVRTLVVDGSATAAETASVLEADGNEVVVVDSLSEARLKLRDYAPNAVVTEYQLPDGSGVELLHELRDKPLPVIVYTAHGSEQVASDCIDADVSAYIPKNGAAAREQLREAVDELAMTDLPGTGLGDVPEATAQHIVQAVDEAPVGVTLSDPSLPDNPIVYANEGYADLTGYEMGAVLGRNCRFLQGPETDEQPVAEMRAAIDSEEPVTVELLNYRENGTPFWNRVTIAPLYEDGTLAYFMGFQEDVTERKEAEALARQRADALREERQTLERVLGRVSGLLNNVSHALVEADSRDDVEQQVCAEIAATDGYSHAWMGEPQVAGPAMTVRVSEGRAQTQPIETGSNAELSGTVFERALEQNTVVVPTAEDRVPPSVAPERFDAAAMAAVPLTYRRTTYGVLSVYAERAEVLDRRECTVFDVVGQMIASGINAVEAKQILTADRVTELGFEITDGSFPLIDLATRAGGAISYNGSTLEEDGSFRLFVTVSGIDTDEPFESVLDSCADITDGYIIAEQDETVAASVTLADPQPFGEFAEYGATLQDLSVSGSSGTAQLHIDLPIEGDPRSVLAILEDVYDGVNLIRQREREREPQPTADFTTAVADRLTDRQYTALETAYLSDYFDFPRPVSGEELADSMGISRQTYHQHLRAAQRKLLEEFFESQ
jgi:PAS domain S-box-containing protein